MYVEERMHQIHTDMIIYGGACSQAKRSHVNFPGGVSMWLNSKEWLEDWQITGEGIGVKHPQPPR